MKSSRREFLGGTAWMGAAAVLAGCMGDRLGLSGGGSMAGFAAKPMPKVRVAVVGVGSRGFWALQRLIQIPGVEITAVCDVTQEKIGRCAAHLAEKGKPKAGEYCGEEAYRRLIDDDVADVFYNCTPRDLHVALNVRAMDGGMHVLTEVPGSMTLDGCWETVEACERNHVHCMMLENACYNEFSLLAQNLAASGVLGRVVHCDGSYIHNQRGLQFKSCPWRLHDTMTRKGNYYPTHGIGTPCKCLNVNHGDRFDFLVSMETAAPSFEGYAREVMKGTSLENAKMSRGDVNMTLVRTVKGGMITLEHNVAMPRPYDMVNRISGTKGLVRGFDDATYRVAFEEKLGDNAAERYFDKEKARQVRERYMHPLWKSAGDLARKVGGHGGCDFLMDVRWAYCMQNGLPLDTNVYDLATWSSIVELTDRSVRSGCRTVECPDFTRGEWERTMPFAVEGVDAAKMGLA